MLLQSPGQPGGVSSLQSFGYELNSEFYLSVRIQTGGVQGFRTAHFPK